MGEPVLQHLLSLLLHFRPRQQRILSHALAYGCRNCVHWWKSVSGGYEDCNADIQAEVVVARRMSRSVRNRMMAVLYSVRCSARRNGRQTKTASGST